MTASNPCLPYDDIIQNGFKDEKKWQHMNIEQHLSWDFKFQIQPSSQQHLKKKNPCPPTFTTF